MNQFIHNKVNWRINYGCLFLILCTLQHIEKIVILFVYNEATARNLIVSNKFQSISHICIKILFILFLFDCCKLLLKTNAGGIKSTLGGLNFIVHQPPPSKKETFSLCRKNLFVYDNKWKYSSREPKTFKRSLIS